MERDAITNPLPTKPIIFEAARSRLLLGGFSISDIKIDPLDRFLEFFHLEWQAWLPIGDVSWTYLRICAIASREGRS